MYWTICVMVVVCVVLVTGTHALTCTQKDLCSCSLDDGSGDIDVSSLGSQDGNPMFKDMASADGQLYSLNLCYPFNELACSNAAACQVLTDGSSSYQIGDATNVGFETDTLNQVHIKYTNIDESTGLMSVNSKCGCPGQCGGGPLPPGNTTTEGPEPTTTEGPDPTTTEGPEPTTTEGPHPTTTEGPHPGPQPNTRGSSGGISIDTVLVIVVTSIWISFAAVGAMYIMIIRRVRSKEMMPDITSVNSFYDSGRGLPGSFQENRMDAHLIPNSSQATYD